MGSEEFAHFSENESLRWHGLPEPIVFLRGSIFGSAFFEELTEVCRLLGRKSCMSTAYHRHSDGQAEKTQIAPQAWRKC